MHFRMPRQLGKEYIEWNFEDKNSRSILKDSLVKLTKTKFVIPDNSYKVLEGRTSLLVSSNMEVVNPYGYFINVFKFFPVPEQIKYMKLENLDYNFSIPDDISRFQNLKKLEIDNTNGHSWYYWLGDSIRELDYSLKPFPTISSKLSLCTQLEELIIKSYFHALPSLEGITTLKKLNWFSYEIGKLSYYYDKSTILVESIKETPIVEVPKGIENNLALESLKINSSIAEIPTSYSHLKALKDVALHTRQHNFPTCVWEWQELNSLHLSLPNVDVVPDSFLRLKNLTSLNLQSKNGSIPNTIWQHPNLESLTWRITNDTEFLNFSGEEHGKRLKAVAFSLKNDERSSTNKSQELKWIQLKNIKIQVYFFTSGDLLNLKNIEFKNIENLELNLGHSNNKGELNGVKNITIHTINESCGINIAGTFPQLKNILITDVKDGIYLRMVGELPQLKKITLKNSEIGKIDINLQLRNYAFPLDVKKSTLEGAKIKINLVIEYKASKRKAFDRLLRRLEKLKAQIKKQGGKETSIMELRVTNYNSLSAKERAEVKPLYTF
jgi:hypothetical protein